jgi:hypothetical protein
MDTVDYVFDQFGLECEGLIIGVPSLAIGVSKTTPGMMFVENAGGEICGWVVKRPRMGLYLAIMRWLRPWAAVEAGCGDAYRLGFLSADVEIRLWVMYDRAQQADAFFRNRNDALGDPEENLRALLAEADQILRSAEVEETCRADDGAIGFYESARKILDVGEGITGGPAAMYDAITRAHGRALQASTYLYGTCRAPGVA